MGISRRALSGKAWDKGNAMSVRRALNSRGFESAPLLTRLLGRAGVVEVPPPVPAKRPRGRPRKATAEVAADIWSDVTGGSGVVLVDGKEVPPSDVK